MLLFVYIILAYINFNLNFDSTMFELQREMG